MKTYRTVFLQRRISHSLKQRNWQSPWRQQQKAVSKFKKNLTYPPKEFTGLAEESFEVEGEAQEHPPMCSRHTSLKDEEKHPATGAMAPITLLSVDSNKQFAISVRNMGI